MSRFRNMIARRIVSLLVLAIAGACAGESQEIQPQSRIIAVIKGQPVLQEQFEDFLSLRQDQLEGELVEFPKKALFREFLTEELLLHEAEKEKIALEESEVQLQLDRWLSKEQEVTPALLERVRVFLKIQKFVTNMIGSQIIVSLQEMQKYYQEHEEEFIIEDQAHVLEILVDDQNRAEEIGGQLKFGDVRTFKSMAQRLSRGLTAEVGGDLGIFERGQLPEDFEKAVFTLKAGEVSPLFRSAEGYHIFMLEEWVPRHAQKFYEVQETIFKKLVAKKERVALDEYVNQLFQAASVEIFDESLNFEWSETSAKIE
ncbi:peptidylprolyl isomerase [Acidobacteria bacterium AH-259-O06]|nr:peptidylprolyl isomerase [Acidobacteria bacterium AH-259-O06]